MFVCECGKTFESYRQLNGHKSTHTRGEHYAQERAKLKKPKEVFTCLFCGNENERSAHTQNKYCNNKCQADHRYQEAINLWDSVAPGIGAIKRWLKEVFGDKCSVCGLSKWNEKPLMLELEHKDGNSENNNKDNLCLICPNCHSQTPTYRAKNKGNGRTARMIKYYERMKKYK